MEVGDGLLEFLRGVEPPIRHYILRIGAFEFYWFWINVGSLIQMRYWIVSWHTRRNLIHLSHHKWWVPICQFPQALRASWRVMQKS